MAFGALAVPLTIAGGLISAASSVYSGLATAASDRYNAEAADYKAAVATQDAQIATKNAQYAVSAGAAQAAQQDFTNRAVLGNEKAVQGSSGLDVNSGSAVAVRSSTAALGNLSTMNIVNNAAREAYGFQIQGMNYEAQSALDSSQAQLDNSAARGAVLGGIVGAVGDLVNTGAKAGGLSQQLKNNGADQPASAGTPNLATGGVDPATAYTQSLKIPYLVS
jgi:hypothetical protein